MPTTPTRHGPLHWLEIGSGPPLVLIHGNTMTASSQARLAQRFADTHTVTSIDLLGHGGSATPEGLFSTRYFQMHGEALADFLAAHFSTPVPVFGMSAGALTALNAACVAPERIAALVLDGVVRFINSAIVAVNHASIAGFSPAWQRAMRAQHGDAKWQQLVTEIPHVMSAYAAESTDLIPCLAQIAIPALVFQGGQDGFCPEDQGRAIVAALQNGTLHYDAAAGHLLAWIDPNGFREIVRVWLAGMAG